MSTRALERTGTPKRMRGSTLSWLEAGDAASSDVLLLLHGFPLNAAMWRPQLAKAPDGWRVIAPDLRGFGESATPTGSVLEMDALAGDVEALMRELGVRRAVVCGLSMGGYVAFALLNRNPSLLRGLALCDTRAVADTAEARHTRLQDAERVHQEGTDWLIDALLQKLLSRHTRTKQPDVVREVRSIMEQATPAGVVTAQRGMAERPDSTPLLRGIVVPTLVIVGEHDEVTPVGDARLMARAIPGAQFEVIPDAGHLSNLEQPDSFNRILNGFLAGVR